MQRKMTTLALALLLACLPLGLAGCGGSDGTASDDGVAQETTQQTAGEETGAEDGSEAVDADAVIDAAVADFTAQGKTVTGTERFDDCDGSGHGVAEITFDDGTTEEVEY